MNIKAHPQYASDDYKYLKAKGWTDDEIITRWNEEFKRGAGVCRWDNLICPRIDGHLLT